MSNLTRNPTIVITWGKKQFPFWGCFANLEAVVGMDVRIKGAGFNPGDLVNITICEKDVKMGGVKVNPCGAFEFTTAIPAGVPLGVATVRAWVSTTVWAVWPLDIVKVLPKPPC
jgi:hypothetical protein